MFKYIIIQIYLIKFIIDSNFYELNSINNFCLIQKDPIWTRNWFFNLFSRLFLLIVLWTKKCIVIKKVNVFWNFSFVNNWSISSICIMNWNVFEHITHLDCSAWKKTSKIHITLQYICVAHLCCSKTWLKKLAP